MMQKLTLRCLISVGLVLVGLVGCSTTDTLESLKYSAARTSNREQARSLHTQIIAVYQDPGYVPEGLSGTDPSLKKEYVKARLAGAYTDRYFFGSLNDMQAEQDLNESIKIWESLLLTFTDAESELATLYSARGLTRKRLSNLQGAESDYTQSIRFNLNLLAKVNSVGTLIALDQAHSRRAAIRQELGDAEGAKLDERYSALYSKAASQQLEQNQAQTQKEVEELARSQEAYYANLRAQGGGGNYWQMNADAAKAELGRMQSAYGRQQNNDADARTQQRRRDCNATGRSGGYDC